VGNSCGLKKSEDDVLTPTIDVGPFYSVNVRLISGGSQAASAAIRTIVTRMKTGGWRTGKPAESAGRIAENQEPSRIVTALSQKSPARPAFIETKEKFF
ncbi:hypothetical protein ACFFIY_00570, partial [Bhargavaea ullalensis]